MRTQIYNLNLNVGIGIPPSVKVSQGDIGRTIGFRIYEGARAYIPGYNDAVIITGTKPSGLGFTETCQINGTLITVSTTNAMTQESGKIDAELRISNGTYDIGTANFVLYVEPAPHPEGTTDGTTEEARTVLEQCAQYAQEAHEAASDVSPQIETLVNAAVADKMEEIEDAVQSVADAASEAVNDINAAGEAVEESIPADYTALSTQVSQLQANLDQITDDIPNVNLFSGYTETGRIDNTSGADVTTTAYVRSEYIPIDASKGTLYILRTSQPWDMKVFFYDSDKTFISPNVQVFNASATVLTGNVSIPSNAVYVRTYRNATVSGDVEFSYTQESEYTPYETSAKLKDRIVTENALTPELNTKIARSVNVPRIESDLLTEKSVNIFDGTFPNSGYFDADGVDVSGANWKRTEYIPIDASETTLYFLRTEQPYVLNGFFYDSNKAGIGSIVRLFDVNTTSLQASVAIPSNASYFRMYTHATNYSGNLMLSYSEKDEFVEYGEMFFLQDGVVSESNLDDALKAKINKGLELTGKTIAFIGDSIIGNFYDATGVCAHLAEKTGATVINCAFGGSRIAYEHSNWGDATPTATGYVEGATDAQKNQVDQYRFWNALCGASLAVAIATGTWTLQDNAVANMASGLSYFAERLSQIKAIDWSTVDFIMWEYGTNDFMTNVALEGNDLFAYDYAFCHTIETILTAYPNIRIITATPIYRWYQSEGTYTDDSNTHTVNDYNGTSHKLTDFVEMAQIVSREYQVPCIDNYYTVGANRFTRLAFFDSTDGTHPNAQGRKRIAEHIASQLMSLI